jgi:DNA-binding transcriptional LysR family regulator
LKGLEARLGVRLLNRTSRSVTLTAAGEELRDSIGGAVETIGDAVENLNRFRGAPAVGSGSTRESTQRAWCWRLC